MCVCLFHHPLEALGGSILLVIPAYLMIGRCSLEVVIAHNGEGTIHEGRQVIAVYFAVVILHAAWILSNKESVDAGN